jgi:hypothetical protein
MRPTYLAVAHTAALFVCTATFAGEPAEDTLPRDVVVKEWWQRFLSIPTDVAADVGETTAACGLAQFGNTWFLSVNATTGAVTRECIIPKGRKLVVPLVSAGCTPFPGETLEQNIQFCREAIDPYDQLSLTVNGRQRNGLIERRAHSRGFSAWFPEDNSFDLPEEDIPEGVYIMVAEGQFAVLEGLPVGEHVIRAQARSTTDTALPEFDVTYRVKIVTATSVTFE